jgi:hypothetical protein
VHRALALALIGLLVHFQVVGLTCCCAHDDDGCAAHAAVAAPDHAHAGHAHHGHAHAALAVHDAGGATQPSKPEDTDHKHRDGSHPCECTPAPVFAPPETATLSRGADGGPSTFAAQATSVFARLEVLTRPSSARHARPPPLGRCISSHAPWCLPGLQI